MRKSEGREIGSRPCPLCYNDVIKPYHRVQRKYAEKTFHLFLGQCVRCKFVFLLNDPCLPYDSDYIRSELFITSDDSLVHFRVKERLAAIARLIPPEPGRRFLDIGIGDGLLLSVAERFGYATFGIDVNPAGVLLARKKYGLQAQLSLQPLEIAFPGVTFDIIHMNEVIEHIAEPLSFLHICRSRLRPTGYLVIQTGNIDSLVALLKGSNWDYFHPMHTSYFSTRTLKSALERAGFQKFRFMTIDWRLLEALKMSFSLLRKGLSHSALEFLFLVSTAQVHGVRRSITVYAQ